MADSKNNDGKIWLLLKCSRCDGELEQNVTRCKSENAAKKIMKKDIREAAGLRLDKNCGSMSWEKLSEKLDGEDYVLDYTKDASEAELYWMSAEDDIKWQVLSV